MVQFLSIRFYFVEYLKYLWWDGPMLLGWRYRDKDLSDDNSIPLHLRHSDEFETCT